jgi:predicted AlkP superfamily phosphohydrolase/phosphomutase
MARKVLVVGLDCADARIVFDDFRTDMPNISKMMERGAYGKLRSIIPPITIPAWLCMATGKGPGTLGLYGFRHRKGYSYKEYWIANANAIKFPTVWDIAGAMGKKSCLVGIPPSYPPYPVEGWLIGDFITPDVEKDYTHPPELKDEIRELIGEYIFDVVFRTDDKDMIKDSLYEMTDKRIKLLEHLAETKPWDLFWFVEIGVDRLHHAFWKYYDKTHSKYEPESKYKDIMRDYYRKMDALVGRLREIAGEDCITFIVSDHGAKRMDGVVAVNEWLIKEGYMTLKTRPPAGTKLEKTDIDWTKTRAWGWGGYYARIFLNVDGREPMGIVSPDDYEDLVEELKKKFEEMLGPDGKRLGNRVFIPEELYGECEGDVPDLMVFFGDLFWRSAGTLGYDKVFLSENDTGPDDAMHDWEGIIVVDDPKREIGGVRLEGASILDIAPTIMKLLGGELKQPEGKVIREITGGS